MKRMIVILMTVIVVFVGCTQPEMNAEKRKLSQMSDGELEYVLTELGVLELFFNKKYMHDIRFAVEEFERDDHSGPITTVGGGTSIVLFEEVYRACLIYYSDLFPLD